MLEQEISAAVDWWTAQLQQPARHDAGDFEINTFAWMSGMKTYTPLSDAQLTAFRAALQQEITALVELHPPLTGNPHYGAALRTVSVDYQPDDTLSKATKTADIDSFMRFPLKTVMWIDPGYVSVRCGYGAQEEVVWQASAPESEARDA